MGATSEKGIGHEIRATPMVYFTRELTDLVTSCRGSNDFLYMALSSIFCLHPYKHNHSFFWAHSFPIW